MGIFLPRSQLSTLRPSIDRMWILVASVVGVFHLFGLVLCVMGHGVLIGSLRLIPFLNAEGQGWPTVESFNPGKKHRPTMLMNMTISDAIEPRMHAVFMVEETRTRSCLTLLSSFLLSLLIVPTLFV